jgi:hypothetical protein
MLIGLIVLLVCWSNVGQFNCLYVGMLVGLIVLVFWSNDVRFNCLYFGNVVGLYLMLVEIIVGMLVD